MTIKSFEKSYLRLQYARIEFREFMLRAKRESISASKTIPRLNDLKLVYNIYCNEVDDSRFQIWLGNRSTFRKNATGKVISEGGLALLYELGPKGDMVIALYPAKSDISHVSEDHLYLYIGYRTGHQLIRRLSSDLKDLAAYAYVTSLDGEPTIRERLRVWWLRKTCHTQKDGKFVKSNVSSNITTMVLSIIRVILTVIVMAIMKPLGILIVILLLLYLGFSEWARIIQP